MFGLLKGDRGPASFGGPTFPGGRYWGEALGKFVFETSF